MEISERISVVLEHIDKAAVRSGRQSEDISLIAVTKTWPTEVIVDAYQAGLRDFGENRAEELSEKKPQVETLLGTESGIVWHAIGSLQSRKTNDVADHADVFHALDRLKIANRISRRLAENGRADTEPLPVFLEVNISGESSKAGINCQNWENDASQRESLMTLATSVAELLGLRPQGLMTMAPWQVEERLIRQVFRRTRLLSEWLQEELPGFNWSDLSMGMTDDYEIAIEEGATHVRIGRAIFGPRR